MEDNIQAAVDFWSDLTEESNEMVTVITNPKNGDTLETTVSDEVMVEALQEYINNHPHGADSGSFTFVRKLMTAFSHSVTKNWTFSDGQRFWLHKLGQDITGTGLTQAGKDAANSRASRSEQKLKFVTLALMFETASKKLRYPKLKLEIGDTQICLKKSGRTAKHPGVVNITNGLSFHDPNQKWYGRIEVNGDFTPSKRDYSDEVVDLLTDLNDDPNEYIARYGKKTGNCSMCCRPLSDERSLKMGYGPICANNFGLPYNG